MAAATARDDPASAGARWLSAAEQRAWRSWLAADRLLLDRLDRQLQDDAGMSHADYEILVHLSEADDDRMRMSELAERALFSRSRLSHAVSRLERLGWVAREDCATDRRGMYAVLTPTGRAALEAAAPGSRRDRAPLRLRRARPRRRRPARAAHDADPPGASTAPGLTRTAPAGVGSRTATADEGRATGDGDARRDDGRGEG